MPLAARTHPENTAAPRSSAKGGQGDALPSATNQRAQLVFRLFPGPSARFLADRFLVPWTRIAGLDPGAGPLETLSLRGRKANAQVRGRGPLIILTHGWAGSGAQFAELSEALLEAGFKVATFDAFAHGSTPGRATNAHEIAELVVALDARHGPALAIVGHSLGGLSSAMAAAILHPPGLVLLAPMPSFSFALDSYQQTLGFDDAMKERVAKLVERRARTTRASSRVERGLSQVTRSLIIHDRADRRIPVQVSRELRSRFPEAHSLETEGLGHSRILADASVRAEIVRFLLALSRSSKPDLPPGPCL